MNKILFYTSNVVGLGHLRRTSLIAQSIKETDPKTDILFITLCKKAHFLNELNIPYVKLQHPTDNLLEIEEYSKLKKTIESNKDKLIKTVSDFRPDIIVVDVFLFGFSFPYGILLQKFNKISKILILRIGDGKSLYRILQKNKEIINKFSKIVLPHSSEELRNILPKTVYDSLIRDKKFSITGPIVEKINQDNIKKCRRKYNISKNDFLITITLGGGGELINGRCESPLNIVKNFIKIYEELKNLIPNIKVILCTGPLFQHNNKIKRIKNKIKVVNFEKHLLELIHLSSLVIASAGYNISNEIIRAGTPAILIPLSRNSVEQFERASYLEKKGVVKICYGNSLSNLKNLVISCKKDLGEMHSNITKFPDLGCGKEKAASLILSHK